ncbi:MAG: serine/threonine protein kinase [Phycisphaerales bacterium]|nr:serine/threonine protein kinase [Phycisphaerales bacterium]
MAPNGESSQASTSDRDMIERARVQAKAAAQAQRRGLIGSLANVAASIPGYQVLGEAKRGGQGIVYKALQLSTKRQVAIKVLIDGATSSYAESARFEREVHVLAQLHHPHIVSVHDSGQTSGHFYCVMDYITGESLDDYVERIKPSVHDRLQLFAEVCEAVNAAHLLGVIHRDLKPSNIRVDEAGHPHILDFGLAKTTGDAFAESPSAMTMSGQFLGSLQWASPEQAEGGASRIDTRTDVYSLGVIAYHMLAGRFPYDVSGSMKQILNNIVDLEPTKLRSVDRSINPDVEAIVMKTLAKERERRYQTAGELARDVRRFLAGEAIEARGDSTAYVMRKMLRKHWPVFATAAAFVALVIGFGITMTVLRGVAVKQRQIAEAKTEEALATVDTFVNAIGSVRPEDGGDKDIPLRSALIELKDEAEDRLGDKPMPLARVHDMLGQSFESLAQLEPAEASYERALDLRLKALGEHDRETIKSMNVLAVFYKKNDRLDDAAPLFERVAAALPTLRRGGPRDQRDVAAIRINLARWYEARGDKTGAAASYRAAIEDLEGLNENEDLRARAFASGNLGGFLTSTGAYDEASERLRACVDALTEYRGEGHPETAIAQVKLAHLLVKQDRIGEAEQLYRQAIDVLTTKMGPGHPATLATRSHLYELTIKRDGYAAGRSIIEDMVAQARTTLGESHADTVLYIGKLGMCQAHMGEDDLARPNLELACERLRQIRKDPCHPDCIRFTKELAAVCERMGDAAGAAAQNAVLEQCDDQADSAVRP